MTIKEEEYPYWKPDFDKEMKGFEVWFVNIRGEEPEIADGHRVFMIMCNNQGFKGKTRMEILQTLKDATEEYPIRMNGEVFWTEEIN